MKSIPVCLIDFIATELIAGGRTVMSGRGTASPAWNAFPPFEPRPHFFVANRLGSLRRRHAVSDFALEPLVIRDQVVHSLPQQLVGAPVCASRQVVQLGFGVGREVQFHNKKCTTSQRPFWSRKPDGAANREPHCNRVF
jgi:hypothetical protein